MDLDKVAARIRPRNGWEGIDLGFALARRWYRPLLTLWMCLALPTFVVLNLLLPVGGVAALLIFWWLKPLWEPPMLYWLSRALFGEKPGYRAAARELLRLGPAFFVAKLTIWRFSFGRSFNLPVHVLEKLPPADRKRRISELGMGISTPEWLTITFVHLELVIYTGLIAAAALMIPSEFLPLAWEEIFLAGGQTMSWIHAISYFVALGVLAPFYVASGFALYLSRRTELEAWDLELEFRQLQRQDTTRAPARIVRRGAVALLAIALALPVLSFPSVAAEVPGRVESAATVSGILDSSEVRSTETHWRWAFTGEEQTDEQDGFNWLDRLGAILATLGSWVAQGVEIVLWIVAGVLLVVLLMRLRGVSLPAVGGRPATRTAARVDRAGFDETVGDAPAMALQASRELLAAGKVRDSLALLYRTSLASIGARVAIKVPDSATESEVLETINTRCPEEHGAYLRALTRAWMTMAWAHREPEPGSVRMLLDRFEGLLSNG